MSRIVLSPRAQSDLDEIWNYTAARWNDDQGERYIRDIWQAVEAVAGDPRKGRVCDEIRLGYRKHPVGSHVIFYRVSKDAIVVIRILHQRMDFERHL